MNPVDVEAPFGTVDIAGDYRDLLEEVVAESIEIYDLTYNLVIELMSEPTPTAQEEAILSQLQSDDLIQMMAEKPEQARLILQRLRRMKERRER